MGLTVSDQANLYYSLYSFSGSDINQSNAVNTSSITKNDYNVSNLTNALDSVSRTDKVSFSSIGNVDSYAKDAYALSQLSGYSTLIGDSNNVSGVLSNTSNMYNLLSYSRTLDTQLIKAVANNDSFDVDSLAADTNPYSGYLSSTSTSVLSSPGSLLDILA